MRPTRRPLVARLLLISFALLCGAWLAQLDYPHHISTDVLDLIPEDERQPELALVRQLASQQQARVALFVLRGAGRANQPALAPEQLDRARDAFLDGLRRAPEFAEVVALDDPELREGVGRLLFQRRFDLLFPTWLERKRSEFTTSGSTVPFSEWLATSAVKDLATFLEKPDALGLEEALPSDPLLLIPEFVGSAQGLAGGAALAGKEGDRRLVWARLAASPLSEEGQQPVFAAVAAAEQLMRSVEPAMTVDWTSVARFAAESRRRMESEISVLNSLSLVAVLTVAACCLRRVWQLLHLAPGVLCSFLGAWTATTLLFDRVHILVLVIGAMLGGIASDYGLHVYLHPGSPGQDFAARLRAVRRPLLGSALTAMLGFSALLFSDLPLLRQLGVFVLAGLVSAMGCALLWFAQVREPQGALRPRVQRGLSMNGTTLARIRAATLGIAVLVVAAGAWRIHWQDDIRDLDVRLPGLRANDRAVRAEFGESPDRQVYLARGDTPAGARAALATFANHVRVNAPEAELASLGFALPTREAWQALPQWLLELDGFDRVMRERLEVEGFDAGAFAPFYSAWRDFQRERTRPDYASLVHDFAAALRGPANMLYQLEPPNCWFSVSVDGPVPAAATSSRADIVPASQLESLNGIVAAHRHSALRLSLAGLAAASLAVILVYGRRHGLRMLLLPLGACLVAFSVVALTGRPLTLFHLVGAFLALCLCFDYAIFTGHRAAEGGRGAPPSVRLSALNTVAAFGVLAFSTIPVVAALGVTVALIAGVALWFVEVGLLARDPEITPPG